MMNQLSFSYMSQLCPLLRLFWIKYRTYYYAERQNFYSFIYTIFVLIMKTYLQNAIHHKVSYIIERLHCKIEFSFCDTRPSKYVFLHSHARNTQRQVLLCVTQTNLKKKVISLQNLQALHLQAGRFRITSWYVYTWACTFA